MDNDFNTAQAIGQLFDTVKILNKITRSLPAAPGQADLDLLGHTAGKLKELANIMGLLTEDPVAHTQALQERRIKERGLDPAAIEAMIADREEARQNKDWARGDAIRDDLLAKGVELKDGPDGTTWKVKG